MASYQKVRIRQRNVSNEEISLDVLKAIDKSFVHHQSNCKTLRRWILTKDEGKRLKKIVDNGFVRREIQDYASARIIGIICTLFNDEPNATKNAWSTCRKFICYRLSFGMTANFIANTLVPRILQMQEKTKQPMYAIFLNTLHNICQIGEVPWCVWSTCPNQKCQVCKPCFESKNFSHGAKYMTLSLRLIHFYPNMLTDKPISKFEREEIIKSEKEYQANMTEFSAEDFGHDPDVEEEMVF